jgi:hypothetical protein
MLVGDEQAPLAILDIGSQDRKNLNQIADRGFRFRVRGAVGQRALLCDAPVGLPDVCVRCSEILFNTHERLRQQTLSIVPIEPAPVQFLHLLAIPLVEDMDQIDPAL